MKLCCFFFFLILLLLLLLLNSTPATVKKPFFQNFTDFCCNEEHTGENDGNRILTPVSVSVSPKDIFSHPYKGH